MPHYRFFKSGSLHVSDQITFTDEEYRHIVKVMRLEKGELLEIVNGNGFLAIAKITTIDKSSVKCLIQKIDHEKKEEKEFIIAQAIIKPSSLELICEKNAELGASEIWIFPADYSEKESLSDHQIDRISRHFISAIKQSGRLYLPKIRSFPSLDAILEELGYTFLFGDTTEKKEKIPQKLEMTPVFIVGPEKGFSLDELSLLKKRGAKGVILSKNVLRAETASIAASTLLGVSLLC